MITKFSIAEAKKIVRNGGKDAVHGGYYMMHIEWFSPEKTGYQFGDLEKENPDCGYVLLVNEPDIHWRQHNAIFGLVLFNPETDNELSREDRYGLR